ncbi:MAG: PIN domain-containing protein [Thermoleophilia bacterium]
MPAEPDATRAVAFVDGQNLFYAVKEAFGYTFPNYDIPALASAVCARGGWRLSGVRFYTGIPSAQDDPFWNHFWTAKLAVMGTRGVVTYSRSLKYRNQTVNLPDGSTTTVLVGREKGIDVRLALDVVRLGLEKEQTESRGKESTSAWTSKVTGELADRKSGVVDELLIFLRAMVCRARLTTATASALAAEGDGETALRLMDHLDEDLRRDYHDLHNRIAALARTMPDAPLWQRVPVLSSSGLPKVSSAEREQAHAMVSRIAKLMEQTVGASLPERDAGVSMLVSADSLRLATANVA